MTGIRTILLRYRTLAFAIVFAALCFRAVMPAGTMLSPVAKVLTVSLCDGIAGNHPVRDIIVPLKGKPAHGEKQQDCAFSPLGMAALGAPDAAILAAALAFAMALTLAPLPVRNLQTVARLRPPLRAPPFHS